MRFHVGARNGVVVDTPGINGAIRQPELLGNSLVVGDITAWRERQIAIALVRHPGWIAREQAIARPGIAHRADQHQAHGTGPLNPGQEQEEEEAAPYDQQEAAPL